MGLDFGPAHYSENPRTRQKREKKKRKKRKKNGRNKKRPKHRRLYLLLFQVSNPNEANSSSRSDFRRNRNGGSEWETRSRSGRRRRRRHFWLAYRSTVQGSGRTFSRILNSLRFSLIALTLTSRSPFDYLHFPIPSLRVSSCLVCQFGLLFRVLIMNSRRN